MKKIQIDQRSPEWEQLRKTHITGTVLRGLMGTPYARQEMFYEIIANRLTVGVDSDTEYENPMDRGTRLEPDAVAMFEIETGKKVEQIGFCQSEEMENVAQSPDGYIFDSNDTEALEIKSMGGKNHVKLWFENKVPAEYWWQVIQYFVVNEKLLKLYFVGFNPNIPIHPLHIIEVNKEDVLLDIAKAKRAQEVFLQEVNEKLKEIITL